MKLSRRELLGLAVITEGGLAVLAGALGWWLTVPPWEQTHLIWFDASLGLWACLPMVAMFLVMLRWPIGPWRGLWKLVNDVIVPIFEHATTLDLAIICILAGVGEEWLFRGFLQAGLASRIGLWPALGVASVLFGLLHPISNFYFVFASFFGVYLGVLMLATDNLLTPMIAHSLYDFVVLITLLRLRSRRNDASHLNEESPYPRQPEGLK